MNKIRLNNKKIKLHKILNKIRLNNKKIKLHKIQQKKKKIKIKLLNKIKINRI
jgi:hypothetical protein